MSKTMPKKKHHPASAPKSATKPAEPADTALSWAYPFTPVGKNDAADPMTYFRALAKCENGFYPLGVSGMWHGGVHFADGSAEMLKQDSGVRAIADGKIVAYRLNAKYEETTYPNNAGRAHYSTGFVLIRHELKLPPKPAAKESAKSAPVSAPASASTDTAPPTAAPANNAPSNGKPANDKSLVFFSLYMHTMDWASYQKAIEQAKSNPKPDPALPVPMSYWEGDRYYRVGGKAKDKQTVPKRKAPAQPSAKRINGADDLPVNNTNQNEPPPADSGQDATPPAPETGLHIRELPNGNSKIIGILPIGAEIVAGEGDPTHLDWIKIKSIKSGTVLSAEVGKPVSPQAPWSYVFKGDLDAVVDPKPLDTVVILKEPQRVKAGEVVAHVGQYQWPSKASPIPPKPNYPMLHLEVFAGPDLKDFIDQSRAHAKELNDKNKPLLEIEPGAKLVSEVPAPDQKLTQSGLKLVPIGDAKGSRWIKVQPKSVMTVPAKGKQKAKQTFADVGNPMWVESSLANTISTANVAGWQNFPLDVSKASGPEADFRDVLRRTGLDKLGADNVAIDDKGHHWWNITIGSKDGSARQGWVCDTGHDGVQLRSPWEWPGFELVDNGSVSPADMFKRHIHTTEQYLADEEGTEFKGAAGKVNAGELITKLETAIDTNHDGKVTAQELKHALETRWMAEAVSHLVVRNETEWGGGMGKWEELTPLMKKQTEMWKTELDRLAKLQWWEQVKGVDGFPTDLSPWHFHPIGLLGNFLATVRKRRDYDLGGLSTYYETGGRGPIAISGGQGDPGGVSYGSYQFTSQTRQKHGEPIIGGRVKEFVSWSGFPWPNAFEGLTPGSLEFSDKWRELVKSDESKFHDAEHKFTRETHYDIQIKTIEVFARVDMRYHSHALNDVIWSTCVQHGPSTDVITTAMSSLEPPTETRDYDVKLIDAIYAERGRKNSDGKLVRFIHSSSHGQENVAKRFVSERAKAQHELANEKDY